MDETKNEVFFKVAQWCILAAAFLLPTWFLSLTISPIDFNKILMVSLLTFFAFIFYLAHSIKAGHATMPYHWFFALLGLLLVAWLASSMIAGSAQAIWGFGAELTSFFLIFVSFLLSLMVMLLFSDKESLSRLVFVLALGILATLIIFWLSSVFGLGSFLGSFFATRSFSPTGSWNSLAFAAGFLILILYPYLFTARGYLRTMIGLSIILALLSMAVVNFYLPWAILGFFALVLLSHAIWQRNNSFLWIGLPTILLAISLFGVFSGDIITSSLSFAAPTEVSVSHSATLSVAKQSLKENLIFGSGPTSFTYLWDQFKPSDVNRTIFWGLRFSAGSSYVLTILAELGILPWLLFVALLAILWFFNLKIITAEPVGSNKFSLLAFSAFLLLSYTILVWAFYAVNYVFVVLGFFAIGMSLASLRIGGFFKSPEVSLFREGAKGFVSALAVVLFLLLGIGGLYVSTTKYLGQVFYAKGLNAFNSLNNLEMAEKYLLLSSKFDKSNDLYPRTLSQIYLVRARLFLQDQSTPRELLGSRFKDVLDKSVSKAQVAVAANRNDFENYRTLGKIYELLVNLNATGAIDAAIAQYDEALKRAPINPLIWRDKAMIYLADFSVKRGDQNTLRKAEEALLKSVELKPDYTEGHFLLAQIYDAQGKSSEAISRGEAAAFLAPNDIGTLFQLGLLYYRNNRLNDAEIVLRRAVTINDNYSNARYFLGLIFDRTGRKSDALNEFEKIEALNPGNDEIKKILANLRAGESALASISPPGTAPEKRTEPPVKESDRKR